jgi:hypothetical protein
VTPYRLEPEDGANEFHQNVGNYQTALRHNLGYVPPGEPQILYDSGTQYSVKLVVAQMAKKLPNSYGTHKFFNCAQNSLPGGPYPEPHESTLSFSCLPIKKLYTRGADKSLALERKQAMGLKNVFTLHILP